MWNRSVVRLLLTQGNNSKGSNHVIMLRMGFEPTILVFELWKAVGAIDCAATVIDLKRSYN
jgi:hypothetical protein